MVKSLWWARGRGDERMGGVGRKMEGGAIGGWVVRRDYLKVRTVCYTVGENNKKGQQEQGRWAAAVPEWRE